MCNKKWLASTLHRRGSTSIREQVLPGGCDWYDVVIPVPKGGAHVRVNNDSQYPEAAAVEAAPEAAADADAAESQAAAGL